MAVWILARYLLFYVSLYDYLGGRRTRLYILFDRMGQMG